MRIIRGKYGKRRFDVPRNITARPTTDFARENLFNVIENMIDIEGIRVLDLFAGTGAISLEFASRGAEEVTAVETARTQSSFIISVRDKLGDRAIHVVRGDVFRFLASYDGEPYDVVFADPPYDHERFGEVPELILNSDTVKPGTLVIVEHSKAYSFSAYPGFIGQRVYGSVNFSMFRVLERDADDEKPTE